MAYIVVEASVRTHWKFLQAGPAASWLWLCGLGYCQDGLTDGFIPKSALRYLGVEGAIKLAPRLVDVVLWEADPDGWMMHHYLHHNKAAAEIRAVMKKRGDGGKLGGRPKQQTTKGEFENLQGSTGKPSGEKDDNHIQNPLLSGTTSTTGTSETTGTSDLADSPRARALFDCFWQAYPRKVGKGDAERKFATLKADPPLVQQMLAALTWQINQAQWTRDGGKFIPHPATWLSQHRWEDEPFQSVSRDPLAANDDAWAELEKAR